VTTPGSEGRDHDGDRSTGPDEETVSGERAGSSDTPESSDGARNVDTCDAATGDSAFAAGRPDDGDTMVGGGMTDDAVTVDGVAVHVDGIPTDGATTDGATTDGAATDGAATDGATTDGATTDGATTDGATTDGAGAAPLRGVRSDLAGEKSSAPPAGGGATSRRAGTASNATGTCGAGPAVSAETPLDAALRKDDGGGVASGSPSGEPPTTSTTRAGEEARDPG